MTLLGVSYRSVVANCDESVRPGEHPLAYVRRLALAKARAGAAAAGAVAAPVLGADTAVVLGRQILGKPRDRDEGLAMLAALSGREHRVLTAVAVVQGARAELALSDSRVRFAESTEAERIAYWNTGEPADKAGAYAVQGLGAVFITRIRGSHSGIMGLPLRETAVLLKAFSVSVFPWTLAADVRGRMPTIP